MLEDYDDQSRSPDPPKRRRYSRVSRACNECRVRKIRCNGRQPCEPCQDFERHCTFTSTKGQRVPGAPRTKILEDRLRRARALIMKLQPQTPSNQLTAEVNNIFDSPPGSPSSNSDAAGTVEEASLDDLESMMNGSSKLIPSRKSVAYYGGGSELAYLQETCHFLTREGSEGDGAPLSVFANLFDSPMSGGQDLAIDTAFAKLLPSRKVSSQLLEVVFKQALHMNQFLHEPTFRQQVDRLYDLEHSAYEEVDRDFLPLFHSALALGYLFDRQIHHEHGCKAALSEGMRHFHAARQMIDPHQLRDILGLQALVCLAVFMIARARIVSAHTYVSMAVSACLRMGLHSRASCEGLTPLSQEVKRRVFWTVVKIDVFSSVMLGLPPMLDLDHADQPKPSVRSRDYFDPQRGGSSILGTRHMLAASAQFLDLLVIIRRLVERLYPKTDEELRKGGTRERLTVPSATIAEIEDDFKTWRQGLADALGSQKGQDKSSRTIYGLEMAHNFGHMLLYRPFLHYLGKTKDENPPDPRLLHCATSCVKISRFTITRSEEMLRQGLFMPAAWFSIYTIFLALVTLIFFLATQHGNKDYAAIQQEAERGIRILHRTSCLDTGAQRCLDALRLLTQRSAPAIHLDIDKLASGVDSICGPDIHPSNDETNRGREEAAQQHAAQLRRRRSLATDTINRQLPHRTQTHSAPGVTTGDTHSSLPRYWGGLSYAAPGSSWSERSVNSETNAEPFYDQATLPFQPPQTFKQELGHEEPEFSHTSLFSWPLPVETGFDRDGSSAAGSLETPMVQEHTPGDIAAFLQLNSGELSFPRHNTK